VKIVVDFRISILWASVQYSLYSEGGGAGGGGGVVSRRGTLRCTHQQNSKRPWKEKNVVFADGQLPTIINPVT
jgi:hypothetical protein